jgi:hypothetical protein
MTSKQRAFALIIAIGLCLIRSSAKAAAANPMIVEPPVPMHRFFDAKNIALLAANAVMMAADVASTNRALQVPGTREMNPLAGSQEALLSLKIAGVGAGLGIAYMLHRTGHHRAERVIPLLFGVPSAVAAAHNSRIH